MSIYLVYKIASKDITLQKEYLILIVQYALYSRGMVQLYGILTGSYSFRSGINVDSVKKCMLFIIT